MYQNHTIINPKYCHLQRCLLDSKLTSFKLSAPPGVNEYKVPPVSDFYTFSIQNMYLIMGVHTLEENKSPHG